ncbi:hypothetical protein C8R45DRAFT_937421 [Mycena sanguinolenta]|nr:hypothetical protein C8R45DRAFT_937421 [Mycena sanguinolenta]
MAFASAPLLLFFRLLALWLTFQDSVGPTRLGSVCRVPVTLGPHPPFINDTPWAVAHRDRDPDALIHALPLALLRLANIAGLAGSNTGRYSYLYICFTSTRSCPGLLGLGLVLGLVLVLDLVLGLASYSRLRKFEDRIQNSDIPNLSCASPPNNCVLAFNIAIRHHGRGRASARAGRKTQDYCHPLSVSLHIYVDPSHNQSSSISISVYPVLEDLAGSTLRSFPLHWIARGLNLESASSAETPQHEPDNTIPRTLTLNLGQTSLHPLRKTIESSTRGGLFESQFIISLSGSGGAHDDCVGCAEVTALSSVCSPGS